MISQNYFSNLPPENILNRTEGKNLTNDIHNSYVESSLDNMILNANLENGNTIK